MNKEFKRFLAWRIMSGAFQIMIRIQEQQAKYKDAYRLSRLFNSIQDSITNFQKRTEILDLQYKYQAQQKDNQIMLLAQENQIQSFKIGRSKLMLFSVTAISILLLLILILVFRQNRIKSERKVAEFKQKLLRSQMNPHFIFNSLTSIQNFILQHDDIKASIYLSRFSDLVRNTLSNSQVELITLEEEINTVENYLELQKIRFPEKFEYKINIDKSLNPESINLPPMLTQPFIENAIEHGFKHIGHKGKIELNFKHNTDWIIIHISDNGIGRKKSHKMKSQQEKDHKSLATMITFERIKTINKKLKNKIHFEIIDLKDKAGNGTGTKVVFEIPINIIKPIKYLEREKTFK
jgi:LytS/YehU family sensor histidine kinase